MTDLFASTKAVPGALRCRLDTLLCSILELLMFESSYGLGIGVFSCEKPPQLIIHPNPCIVLSILYQKTPYAVCQNISLKIIYLLVLFEELWSSSFPSNITALLLFPEQTIESPKLYYSAKAVFFNNCVYSCALRETRILLNVVLLSTNSPAVEYPRVSATNRKYNKMLCL